MQYKQDVNLFSDNTAQNVTINIPIPTFDSPTQVISVDNWIVVQQRIDSSTDFRTVICLKQISVEGNGHCCHRPSSNWETNQQISDVTGSNTETNSESTTLTIGWVWKRCTN